MKKLLFVAATLLSIAGITAADFCHPVRRVHAPVVVKKDVVVKEVVDKVVIKEIVPFYTPVAVYAPFAAVVPAYGGAYVPPPNYLPMQPAPTATAPAPAAPQASEMRQVLEILQGFDARLRTLEGRGPPAPPAKKSDSLPLTPGAAPATAPGAVSALQVMQAKCASCHEARNSAEKGGGFTMFEGNTLVRMTEAQLRKSATNAYSGKMPPKTSGISLTDEETGIIINWIDSLK